MNVQEFFEGFYAEVRKSENWRVMSETVEGSEWHREANVAVHTEMCIEHYLKHTAVTRTARQQMLTLITLLFHDFGKPEAEETLERKDGSGTMYNRYAGHEPVSANEFLSFMCSNEALTRSFFDQGFDWADVRKIKWMIENHLPYGLKNPTKRQNFRRAFETILGDDGQCFFDQLWSDCNGRISDNHEEKRANVIAWIKEFEVQQPAPSRKMKAAGHKTMYVMVGPVGAGKTTFAQKLIAEHTNRDFTIVSEDNYRMYNYDLNLDGPSRYEYWKMDPKEKYRIAWQFAADHPKEYDLIVKEMFNKALASGHDLILDRTNQTRKSRGTWIQQAVQAGYRIETIEFYISEQVSKSRQLSRSDKQVPMGRVHHMYMGFDVPWNEIEMEAFTIIPPFQR